MILNKVIVEQIKSSLRTCQQRLEFYWEKFKRWWKKNPSINSLIIGICVLGLFLVITMLLTCEGGIFAWLLGIRSKKETIEFIAFGIGGLLAVMGAIALNRRATAQEKNNDDIRFQDIMIGLGDEKPAVRVATFYRFYYLAYKEVQTDDFRNDVFEMLCSYLRTISSEIPNTHKEKHEYYAESQTLFDILFKGKFKSNEKREGLISDDIPANLRKINLTGIDVSGANLSNTDFREAQLKDVKFDGVHAIVSADFRGATIGDRPITKDDLPLDKGKYYAEWNPPPEKEES